MDKQETFQPGEEERLASDMSVAGKRLASLARADFYSAAPVGYVMLDDSGLILETNRTTTEMLGKRDSELRGQALKRFITTKDRVAFTSFWRQMIAANLPERVELRLRRADGSHFFARLEGHRSVGNGGSSRPGGLQPYGLVITDISEWVQAEQDLQQAHDFIEAVLDTAGALIIVVDQQGRIVRFNRACEKKSGYTFDEVEGELVWEIFGHTADDERVRTAFGQLRSGQLPNEYETYWTMRDGSRRLISWSNSSLVDPRADVKYLIGIGIDVTRRREAEETLQTLVHHSLQGLAILQQDGIVYANEALARITGYSVGELLAMSADDLMIIVRPEDRIAARQRMRDRLAGKPIPPAAEFCFVHKDGRLRWTESHAVLIEYRGKPAVQVAYIDISERKQAEEALRESEELHRITIANISDAVFLTDDTGQFTYICPNAHTIFGYTPREIEKLGSIAQLVGENLFDLAELKAAGELPNIECVIKDKEGQEHALLVNVKRVSIKGGTVLYTCRDITERKQTNYELAQLLEAVSEQREQLRGLGRQLAEAQEAERKALARELHDQVGQKLTALNLNLNTLRSRLPDTVETTEPIMVALNQSLKLVEETTECIQDVMVNLRPPVLDDYGLLAALQWYGAELAARVSFRISVQGAEPDPRLAPPVEHTLFRIAQEALTNVVKHAQATQVTVNLKKDQERVRLIIVDDGQGFELAQGLKPSKRPGWGLLTMVERAEAIGGRCQIQSRSGQGTQIIVEVDE